MKAAGIIIISAICVIFGFSSAQALKLRIDTLKQIRSILAKTRLMIRYEAAPMEDIIQELDKDFTVHGSDFIERLKDGLEKSNMPFDGVWNEAVYATMQHMKEDDRRLMLKVGASLGKCDAEGQDTMLEQSILQAEALLEAAEGEYCVKGKLYRSLGGVAAAASVLLLI